MIKFFKMIYPYAKPYLKPIIIALICSIPLAAIKSYQAYFIKDIFDTGFDPNSTLNDALRLGMILVALAILNYPFRFFHFYLTKISVNEMSCDIRQSILNKLQKLPVSYFSDSKQGEMISKTLYDTNYLCEALKNAPSIVREPITAVLLLGVAFYHDWQLALIILIATPFFGIIFKISGARVKRYKEKVSQNMGDITQDLSESVSGQKIIKAFNIKNYFDNRFRKTQNIFLDNFKKLTETEEHAHPLIELIGALAFAAIIVFAHYRISSGYLTTGAFISFVSTLALFMDPVRKFSDANLKINQAQASAARILSILSMEDEQDDGRIELDEIKYCIEFKNVTFSYSDRVVLENFSAKFEKGKKVGLVGLSGSGKSTIINLILRLYNPNSGQILIDGIDINKYSLKSLRARFALVSQDIFLFNDTVYENLSTGKNFSPEEIKNALEVSYSTDYIENLDQGIDTRVGDRGLKLSGGQAQRLTIARAFLTNAQIYLFDEATSALDNESEKIVQKAMEAISGDKGVIAVAHRLSTIQDYDKIIVLSAGQKLEEGTHSELMSASGEYKKLYELSSGS